MMQAKILAGLYVAAATLFGGGAGFAQDEQALLGLLPDDPNGFVRTVQEKLTDAGLFSGTVNGSLTRSTIAAIYAACRSAGVLADCQSGPLTPRGSAAVVDAIRKLTGEPEAAVAAPAPELPAAPAEPAAVASDALQIATADWHDAPTYGLAVTPTATDAGVEFAISGTSEDRGWTNIYAGEQLPTTPGEAWSFTLDASFASTTGGTAIALVAVRRADGSYITELMRGGVPIAGDGPFVVEGIAPPDAAFVQPYVQIKYPSATVADGTLKLTGASIAHD